MYRLGFESSKIRQMTKAFLRIHSQLQSLDLKNYEVTNIVCDIGLCYTKKFKCSEIPNTWYRYKRCKEQNSWTQIDIFVICNSQSINCVSEQFTDMRPTDGAWILGTTTKYM